MVIISKIYHILPNAALLFFSVKIHGAKNIKAYKSDEITVLNPNMVSLFRWVSGE